MSKLSSVPNFLVMQVKVSDIFPGSKRQELQARAGSGSESMNCIVNIAILHHCYFNDTI